MNGTVYTAWLYFGRSAIKWGCRRLIIMMALFMSSCVTPPPRGPSPAPSPSPAQMPSPEPVSKAGDRFTFTIVYDNNEYGPGLETEWGFSCVIEGLEKTILFDTGGDHATLLSNMRKLKIDPGKIDVIVLSHIHGDHVGGLSGFLEENSDVTVYLPHSFPVSFKSMVREMGAEVDEISEAQQLFADAFTTGELDGGIKEQSLIVATSRGPVIVTGCAHPGVVNIVRKARNIVAEDTVYLVMGGFHMAGAPASRIESVINGFRQLSVRKVAPCHCSGDETRRLFREEYGENYINSGVGKSIAIP